MTTQSNWNAAAFFEQLTDSNRLASDENFIFCRVSGLEGFEEALREMQSASNFVCVSDIADGYTELNNTPRTRRVKTVFFAMRHAIDDMAAREECMNTMQELFRQFMSVLLQERVKLQQDSIYIDPRINFTEIDRYFFSGCACAYFQIAIDKYTDLRYNIEEWKEGQEPVPPEPFTYLYIIKYPNKTNTVRMLLIKQFGYSITQVKEIVNGNLVIVNMPHNYTDSFFEAVVNELESNGITYEFK